VRKEHGMETRIMLDAIVIAIAIPPYLWYRCFTNQFANKGMLIMAVASSVLLFVAMALFHTPTAIIVAVTIEMIIFLTPLFTWFSWIENQYVNKKMLIAACVSTTVLPGSIILSIIA
jgi:hypothetical protein